MTFAKTVAAAAAVGVLGAAALAQSLPPSEETITVLGKRDGHHERWKRETAETCLPTRTVTVAPMADACVLQVVEPLDTAAPEDQTRTAGAARPTARAEETRSTPGVYLAAAIWALNEALKTAAELR